MQPVLSIIIPCYNSGRYLPDALDSIKDYPDKSVYEVIITDDGSTEKATLGLLEQLKADGYHVISQKNKGPAAARNAGVKIAKGEYLLFLDADNKIKSDYISKGVASLSAHPEVDIVYGKPAFFGDTTKPRFFTGPFDMNKIIKENYIDNCVLMRKSIWQSLNGQDENPAIIGHEDWDFWLRAAGAGYKFLYLDEVLFEYRISGSSLVKPSMEPGGNTALLAYLYGKHAVLVNNRYTGLYNLVNIYKDDQQKPLRSFFKFMYHKYLRK